MGRTFLSSLVFLAALLLPCAFAIPPRSHSELAKRQNATADQNGALAGWTFVGCFTDKNPATRSLQEHNTVNPGMTPLLCTQFCNNFSMNLAFAGTEYTDECYCDFNIQGTATKVADDLCNFPCGGDSTLTCGGASLISVFQNSVAPIPANKDTVGRWAFEGCFEDAVGSNPRTLLERFDVAGGVTIEGCTAQCTAAGFNISGLEFGQECWCGNSFALPSENITAPLSDCSRACEANPTQICGAGNRLSVYINGGLGIKPTVTASTTPTPTLIVTPSTTTPTTAAPTTTVPSPTTIAPTTTAKPSTIIPTTSVAPPPAPPTTAKPPVHTPTENPICVRELGCRERVSC